jgi:hypothetical protein
MPISTSISTHILHHIKVKLLTLLALEQHADTTASRLGARSITLAIRQRVAPTACAQEAALAVVVETLATGLVGWVGRWEVAGGELGEVEGDDTCVEWRGGREGGEHAEEEELGEGVEHHDINVGLSWY